MTFPPLRRVVGPALAVLALLFAIAALLLLARGTPIEGVRSLGGDAPAETGDFATMIQNLVPTRLEPGNRIELLVDGRGTFPRLFADLRAARESIAIQVYYWKEGALSDTVAALLAERARAGVRVLALFDDFGADLPDEYYDSLAAAGVRVARLRPVSLLDLHRAQLRSHVRAVVIDGVIGYTGGWGFDAVWLGDGGHPDQWRDTNVRFSGPAVGQLVGAFTAGWAEATGELLIGAATDDAVPGDHAGAPLAGIVFTSPTMGSTPAERLLALSIAAARHRVWITNAYFVPDDDFRTLLIGAARRGVDVRVIAPSAHTDVPIVRLAARAHYAELLDGGVRLFEYQPSMIHSKTLVADGVWSLVGTMNFDNRSLALNDEVTLAALDTALGARMEELFHRDLSASREILQPEFDRRGTWQRIKERFAVLLSRWL